MVPIAVLVAPLSHLSCCTSCSSADGVQPILAISARKKISAGSCLPLARRSSCILSFLSINHHSWPVFFACCLSIQLPLSPLQLLFEPMPHPGTFLAAGAVEGRSHRAPALASNPLAMLMLCIYSAPLWDMLGHTGQVGAMGGLRPKGRPSLSLEQDGPAFLVDYTIKPTLIH